MNRTNYQYTRSGNVEAIQFLGLEKNKFDICVFLKDQGKWDIEFGIGIDEIKMSNENDSYYASPTDWVTLEDGKMFIYEDKFFREKFKKIVS